LTPLGQSVNTLDRLKTLTIQNHNEEKMTELVQTVTHA